MAGCMGLQSMLSHERENYSWGVVQDLIEREVNLAFKLREPPKMPSKKEIKQTIKKTVKQQRKDLLKKRAGAPLSQEEWIRLTD
jgi:hypothetical protein